MRGLFIGVLRQAIGMCQWVNEVKQNLVEDGLRTTRIAMASEYGKTSTQTRGRRQSHVHG